MSNRPAALDTSVVIARGSGRPLNVEALPGHTAITEATTAATG